MSKPSERVQMSSIVPRFLVRAVRRYVFDRLPLRVWDPFNQFWVQTRLIFSRAILLLVGALLLVFSWSAFVQNSISENDVFTILSFQMSILAILLNMNLWEVEREGRTFELLIMRIPGLHRLIWFKMRVSLFWMAVLSLPFFAAYAWFASIPLARIALMAAFIFCFAVLAAFVTCVVASFVHHGLTSGIVTFIAVFITMAFCEDIRVAFFDYIRPFINPFKLRTANLTVAQTVKLLLINRCVLTLIIACFYAWLHRRLGKTEKWIQ